MIEALVFLAVCAVAVLGAVAYDRWFSHGGAVNGPPQKENDGGTQSAYFPSGTKQPRISAPERELVERIRRGMQTPRDKQKRSTQQ